MNSDTAQFREKLVRLRDQTSSAISYLDSDMPMLPAKALELSGDPPPGGFAVGDFVVLDRFSTFTKEPQ